eukprot:gi/632977746/ref/XP_007905517.1/ PREDICTED: POU domain class 2-associating factor 1 [Callorhinchus milii]
MTHRMHWPKCSSDQPQQKPYLGVRVKDPVKELLKRKRKHVENTLKGSTANTATTLRHFNFDEAQGISPPATQSEDVSFHTTWSPHPASAGLQPVSQWPPCLEYPTHEPVNAPYMQDISGPPLCSTYTVVGAPSVGSYTQPLVNNFGMNCQLRAPTPTVLPPLEFTDQPSPLSYFSWSQTFSSLPAPTPTPTLPCHTACPQPVPSQFVPMPLSVPEPEVMELEAARRTIGNMPIEKLLQQDEDNDTILHIYAAKGMREHAYAAAERMRELRRLDTKEHRGKTPLLVAVAANQPLIVRDLIRFGADLNSVNDRGQHLLHLAATYGYLTILQIVGATGGLVNVEARDFEGFTPLHCAINSHNTVYRELCHSPALLPQRRSELQYKAGQLQACIRLLIEMGALVTSQDLKSNKTAIHLSVLEGDLVLLRYFLDLATAISPESINMKAHGNTALHMAAGLRNEPNQEGIIQLLLSYGADPSVRNLENEQPIHLVHQGEQGNRIRQLLRKGRVALASSDRNALP